MEASAKEDPSKCRTLPSEGSVSDQTAERLVSDHRRIHGGIAMSRSSRALLTSPAFIIALGVLVVNDWVLKPEFGNWVTGKLSDFAGVLALPLLWCAFFPARRNAGFLATAVAFILWKSPVVDPVLGAWNGLGMWQLHRVVDYTDYIALVALAPAYRIACRYETASLGASLSPARGFGALGSAIAAILILAADTVMPPRYPVPDSSAYEIAASRSDIQSGRCAWVPHLHSLRRARS